MKDIIGETEEKREKKEKKQRKMKSKTCYRNSIIHTLLMTVYACIQTLFIYFILILYY